MDRPGAQDHLPGRANGMEPAALEEIEACAARAGERQLDRLRLGPDRQAPVTHHRPQVGEKRAAAHAFGACHFPGFEINNKQCLFTFNFCLWVLPLLFHTHEN